MLVAISRGLVGETEVVIVAFEFDDECSGIVTARYLYLSYGGLT